MKNCGSCRHWLRATRRFKLDDGGYDELTEFYCNNDESIYECEERDSGDTCEEWEGRNDARI